MANDPRRRNCKHAKEYLIDCGRNHKKPSIFQLELLSGPNRVSSAHTPVGITPSPPKQAHEAPRRFAQSQYRLMWSLGMSVHKKIKKIHKVELSGSTVRFIIRRNHWISISMGSLHDRLGQRVGSKSPSFSEQHRCLHAQKLLLYPSRNW